MSEKSLVGFALIDMRTASIISASLLVAACLPAPHQHYFAPRVAGVVMEDDAPVANAEIELTGKFTDRRATVRSDGDGHFAIGPIAELEFIQWLIGDPLFGYNLKITVGEHTYLGLSEFGLGYGPSHIEVRCDVSRPGGAGRTPVACPRNDRGEGSHADSTVSDAAKPRVAQPHR